MMIPPVLPFAAEEAEEESLATSVRQACIVGDGMGDGKKEEGKD